MDLKYFLKENQKAKENTTYPATSSLCDDKGDPLEWEIRPISSKEEDEIRNNAMVRKPVPGQRGAYTAELDTRKYIVGCVCASIVSPNLNNKELQDSYGVKKPEDLLLEMVNTPIEYARLTEFVFKFSGLDIDINELADEAKN